MLKYFTKVTKGSGVYGLIVLALPQMIPFEEATRMNCLVHIRSNKASTTVDLWLKCLKGHFVDEIKAMKVLSNVFV